MLAVFVVRSRQAATTAAIVVGLLPLFVVLLVPGWIALLSISR